MPGTAPITRLMRLPRSVLVPLVGGLEGGGLTMVLVPYSPEVWNLTLLPNNPLGPGCLLRICAPRLFVSVISSSTIRTSMAACG